ncbi:MAG: twin transmembrane helix small protein [Kiloniellales bacterium]|nr:twin transmembrane helix small protein [Kiloniellales bacterium]
MKTFAVVLLVLAMLVTLGVLFAGLLTMARGGEFNRRHSNRLMRWRILAQGTALLIFAFAIMLSNAD